MEFGVCFHGDMFYIQQTGFGQMWFSLFQRVMLGIDMLQEFGFLLVNTQKKTMKLPEMAI